MEPETLGGLAGPLAGDDPCYPVSEPVLIALGGVGDEAAALLETRAREARCRLFRPADGSSGAFVLAGQPGDLGLLRNLLAGEQALRRVRESVEERLGRLATPGGLPRQGEDVHRLTEVADEPEVPAGTRLRVARDFLFDAAHNLPRYNGKCERLHGHTFRIRVTVDAPLDRWSGMSFDFHDLKKIVTRRVVDVLDHSYVNEQIANPSAEHIAIWAWQRLQDLPLAEITVWETPTCSVTYCGPPRR